MLALADQLRWANLPALKPTYGAPNPAGAWTTVTASGHAVTVYPCTSSVCARPPAGLRTLIGSLEPITVAHEPLKSISRAKGP